MARADIAGDSRGLMSRSRSGSSRRAAALIACCLAAVAFASGCSGDVSADAAVARGRCDDAFDSVGSGTAIADLDSTIRRCADVNDWALSAIRHPAILGGRDPLTLLGERCGDLSSGLDGYAVCGLLRLALATPSPTPKATHRPAPTHRPASRPRPTSRPKPRVAVRAFPNGDQLNRVYRHGLGRPGAVDHISTGGRRVTTFLRSSALYEANDHLDREGDGIACEQT